MSFRELFDNWKDLRTFAPGETIFAEGDAAENLFFVLEGDVELQRHGAAMSVEGPGGIIGESALLAAANHNGAAVARSDVRLARLDRAQLKELMDGSTEFAFQLMARLALRLRSVDAYIGNRLDSDSRSSGP